MTFREITWERNIELRKEESGQTNDSLRPFRSWWTHLCSVYRYAGKRQYKLQAVQFVKLRRSLIYDLIQGTWKVGHSFTKSSKVTFMRSLSASRIERRCYAYSFAVTFHRTLRAEHWSKMCWWLWRRLQTTSRAVLEVASVTHLRSDSRILESWSLIYEVEQGYIYAKSVG